MSQSLAKMGVGLADGDEVAGGGSAGASAGSGEGEGESTLSLGSLTVSRDSTFVCPTCACVCRCLRGLSSCTVSLRPDRPSIFRFLLPPVVPQGALVELEEEEDKFEALERWLKENGAVFPLLYMKRYSENYRGVHIRTTTGVRGWDTGQVHPVAGTLLSPCPPRALWRCAHVCSCLFAPPRVPPIWDATEGPGAHVHPSAVLDHRRNGGGVPHWRQGTASAPAHPTLCFPPTRYPCTAFVHLPGHLVLCDL
jgi:hypothetical protein